MENEIEILSLNVQEKTETFKEGVPFIELSETGSQDFPIQDGGHRKLSMLDSEMITGHPDVSSRKELYGLFGENIIVDGLDQLKPAVFDRLIGEDIELEIVEIGKDYGKTIESIPEHLENQLVNDHGIFLRVINGGILKEGDRLIYRPKKFQIHIITISDRASKGVYEDRSGPEIARLAAEFFEKNNRHSDSEITVIPDDPEQIGRTIWSAVDQQADIIFTTGGTGIGPRDFTPDVIGEMLDKEIPGIMEMIRVKYGMDKPNALLSRGIAGTIRTTLVYTLPGSVKAVREYCGEIFKTVNHSMLMLHGIGDH